MALIDLRYATIRLQSGSDHIDIAIGEGNLEYTEKRNIEYVKSRGELYTTREGEEEPLEVNLQFVWKTITGSAEGDPPTFDEVLKDNSGWDSTNPDPDAPFCVDIVVTYLDTSCPGVTEDDAKSLFFQQFNYETLAHSFKDATVDCTGKCNIISPTN